MARAILITGGNLGDVKHILRLTQRAINEDIGIILRCSHAYESGAWGFTAESNFLNQAIEVDTELSPEELFATVQKIEQQMGRDREEEEKQKQIHGQNYSSRVIDIDILFYEDEVIATPTLTIPHPLMTCRDFVMKPLVEIAPEKMHPVFKKTIAELYSELESEKTK